MKKVYLYPLWLRIWHIINALLFILLIFTGLNLHFAAESEKLISFDVSVLIHNISGILLSLNYIYFFVFNFLSGNYRHYIINFNNLPKRMYVQAKYYLLGIFNKEPHPFIPDEKMKFNPLQQLGYIGVMYFLMPLIVISGWALMFPEWAPDNFMGMGGIWPMALLHTIVGFFLSIFMLVHIYLGTTGHTVTDLYKTIITGWHLSHEDEEAVRRKTERELKTKGKTFPIIFYNPITLTGIIVAIISAMIIFIMMVIEFFSESTNPYTGIVTFIILPTILLFGIFLIFFGAFKENRRLLNAGQEARERLPIIDLNKPKHQVAVILFTLGTLILLTGSIYGSFKAYEYSDSDEFCGTVCHKVMHPEYTAYLNGAHSRVGCVKCHIGPSAGWFVKSKISGSYQIISVLLDLYSKPIETPVHDLRPSAETCEQCHWPNHFYSEKKISFDFFTSDSANSEYLVTMHLKTGGGTMELGNNSGIHWSMYIENEIEYYALDYKRQEIPWIHVRNRKTGKETFYTDPSYNFTMTDSILKSGAIRKFDCIDCHNRPAHKFNVPNRVINSFLVSGLIDKTLPYIKNLGVQTLEYGNIHYDKSYQDIEKQIKDYYKRNFPEIYQSKQNEINQAIRELNKIYRNNYFPEMKVSWRNYPNNIGHMYSKGCFRCHDGKKVTIDGKVLSNDCNVCHSIIYQKPPNQEAIIAPNQDFIHPGGIDKILQSRMCPDCHGAQTKPKTTPVARK